MVPHDRAFIRHPIDIPIEVSLGNNCDQACTGLRNLSLGGLAFSSPQPLPLGQSVTIGIESKPDPLRAIGHVVWCSQQNEHFEIGLAFDSPVDAYKVRMVEQICHIEQYRRDLAKREGRILSQEQAAREWIEKYADSFAQEGWDLPACPRH